jgi:phosphohistidine phosphatase SixA
LAEALNRDSSDRQCLVQQEREMKRVLGLVLITLTLGACSAPNGDSGVAATAQATAAAEQKPVFVVRHLQKAAGDDPSLTPEGAAAALRLADLLEDDGITAIFATPTRRAMETAQPLANRLGIAVTAYDPRQPETLATAVAAAPGAVLVVGHSNTVHDLVGRFGGTAPPPLSEEDYGTVWVVLSETGATRTLPLEPRR